VNSRGEKVNRGGDCQKRSCNCTKEAVFDFLTRFVGSPVKVGKGEGYYKKNGSKRTSSSDENNLRALCFKERIGQKGQLEENNGGYRKRRRLMVK